MKRTVLPAALSLLAVLFLGMPVSIFPQQEQAEVQRVLLYPISVEPGSRDREVLESLGVTVRDTLAVTLQFMEGFRVRQPDERGPTDAAGLAEYAVDQNVDNVIFGSIRGSGEEISVELFVYDRYEERISAPKRGTVRSLLDTFDMADRLVVELVEDFSGVRVAYGRINLVPLGPPDPYQVVIDGIHAGDSLRTVEKLLVGRHRVELLQERGGEEVVLLERELDIEEGRRYTIEVPRPFLTEAENNRFAGFDKDILAGWSGVAETDAAVMFNRAIQAANTEKEITGLERMYQKYSNWFDAYKVYVDTEEPDEETVFPGILPPGSKADFVLLPDPLIPDDLLWEEADTRLRRQTEELQRFQEFLAAYRAEGRYMPPSVEAERPDQVDWEDAGEWAVDETGERDFPPGSDLSRLWIARSGEQLFLRLALAEGKANVGYRYHFLFENEENKLDLQVFWTGTEWQAKAFDVRPGPTKELGSVDYKSTGDGLSLAVPLEYLAGRVLNERVGCSVEVVTAEREFQDSLEPVPTFIPSGGLSDARIIAGTVVEEQRSFEGTGWMFPLLTGAIMMEEYDGGPVGYTWSVLTGVHYSFGYDLYWGIDALFFPTGTEGGPWMLPFASLIFGSEPDEVLHMVQLLPLPGPLVGGGDTVLIFAGYGFGWYRFTVNALVGVDPVGQMMPLNLTLMAGYVF